MRRQIPCKLAVVRALQPRAQMDAIIPCRASITDRLPVASFVVRTPRNRWFEVACASDPRLFHPAYAGHRTPSNFYTSRQDGVMQNANGDTTWLMPASTLRRFAGKDRIYYALASYGGRGGEDPRFSIAPTALDRVPSIALVGFTGRTLAPGARGNRTSGVAYGGGDRWQPRWGGDFAIATERAQPRPRTRASALKIFGTNEMQLVADPSAVPYRYIARLEIGMGNDQEHGRIFGSGTLIAPDIILTAGHNVRRMGQTGRVTAITNQIKISIAGRGPFTASGWWAPPRWLNAADDNAGADRDYAIIKCSEPLGDRLRVGGELLRSWPGGRGSTLDLVDSAKIVDVRVAGFPTQQCVNDVGTRDGVAIAHPAMMESSGTARPVAAGDKVFGYDADTCPEQSGGPVWIDDAGALTFVGVHHGTWRFSDGTELNSATRYDDDMLNDIDRVWNGNLWYRD
ncbi:MAG TPA: trypsin-like serine protease [Nannocystaceae bacterium]|nr:trypsin-like serine protease [Nannocystaceae bacterium]